MGTDLDFKVVKLAGIAVSHFARLCGVSRVSAHLYLANAVQPRGLYRQMVEQRLQLIEDAVKDGRLPLPRVRRSERFAMTVKALKKPQ